MPFLIQRIHLIDSEIPCNINNPPARGIRDGQWMKRHEDVRETEEDLIKQQEEELRRKKALGKDN